MLAFSLNVPQNKLHNFVEIPYEIFYFYELFIFLLKKISHETNHPTHHTFMNNYNKNVPLGQEKQSDFSMLSMPVTSDKEKMRHKTIITISIELPECS